jgi:hypothetical protein
MTATSLPSSIHLVTRKILRPVLLQPLSKMSSSSSTTSTLKPSIKILFLHGKLVPCYLNLYHFPYTPFLFHSLAHRHYIFQSRERKREKKNLSNMFFPPFSSLFPKKQAIHNQDHSSTPNPARFAKLYKPHSHH